ncbi:MAG: hypothetical protein DLM54_01850 [Acidimicrobiales bacterium]|nr:MAG: hypothetical protein DLM54_01850 [Acidimicrobiales bacterium]
MTDLHNTADVTFFFDPVCPWTWRASRWLAEVAGRRGLQVDWAPLSLYVVNEDHLSDQFRSSLEVSLRALRLVAALRAEGRHADNGRLYAELGGLVHDGGADATESVLHQAAERAGASGALGALDDASWDAEVRRATEEAVASAGPDVGSPVLAMPTASRGLHGPIMGSVPTGEQADGLWAAVVTLLEAPDFFELKRGRR